MKSLKFLKGKIFLYELLARNDLVATSLEEDQEEFDLVKLVQMTDKLLYNCWANQPLLSIFFKGDLFETNFWNKVQDIDNLSLYFNTKFDSNLNTHFSKYLNSTNLFTWEHQRLIK